MVEYPLNIQRIDYHFSIEVGCLVGDWTGGIDRIAGSEDTE